jgi:release factor glutamine methyltransferase
MYKELPVTASQQKLLDDYAEQLLKHTPIQYVLHKAWFAGMPLYVDNNVLIPRPETEELVHWIANLDKPLKILDIGTGSGCIPIALKAKHPEWQVHALDVSAGALEVAKRNAIGQRTEVEFHLADMLDREAWKLLPMFDIIVSNPPYIRKSEAASMNANVLAFEPHTALFVPDDDALLFYKTIADFAIEHLHPDGLLFFEINEALGTGVCNLLSAKRFKNIELRKDLQGKDRMVKATKN